MRDFAAIDFETANNQRSSVCSVGVVVVRNGEIADTFYLCRRCYLPHNYFPKLRQLREEKYDLKFKQRLIALIAGDIVWVLAYWIERVIMGN